MSNSNASCRLSLSIPGPGGSTISVTASFLAAFQALSLGTIDVPDQEAQGTDHVIPFGSIGNGATLLVLHNKTGQSLTVSVNGGDLTAPLADDDWCVLHLGSAVSGDPVVDAKVTTTATTQDGAGSVEFWVCGDPV